MDLSSIWNVILSLVSESGVWAMLFLALLIILIKSNNEREKKYQNIIEKLGNSLKKVEEIKEDVEDLKTAAGIGHKDDLTQQKTPIESGTVLTTKEGDNESKTESKNL